MFSNACTNTQIQIIESVFDKLVETKEWEFDEYEGCLKQCLEYGNEKINVTLAPYDDGPDLILLMQSVEPVDKETRGFVESFIGYVVSQTACGRPPIVNSIHLSEDSLLAVGLVACYDDGATILMENILGAMEYLADFLAQFLVYQKGGLISFSPVSPEYTYELFFSRNAWCM